MQAVRRAWMPSVRHLFLEEETDHEVTLTVDMQIVAHYTMGGGPLTHAGIKSRKFGWFSTWETGVGPMRAAWVVDEGTWSPEWDPTDRELHDLAAQALGDLADRASKEAPLARLKHVLVIHAPRKVAILASDRPLPHGTAGIVALPLQPIVAGPAPSWWPDGTGRPDLKEPEAGPVDEGQERQFHALVAALERANGEVSIATSKAALNVDRDTGPIRSKIAEARAALAQVQAAAVTSRQKRLATRALGYETNWKRTEESLNRIEARAHGVFLPI